MGPRWKAVRLWTLLPGRSYHHDREDAEDDEHWQYGDKVERGTPSTGGNRAGCCSENGEGDEGFAGRRGGGHWQQLRIALV